MMRAVRSCCTAGLLVLPLLAVGCDSGEPTDPAGGGADVAGTYTLEQINGEALPVTVLSGETEEGSSLDARVTAGQISLDDGIYDFSVKIEVIQDGETFVYPPFTDHGRYTVDGQTVTLDSDNANIPGTDAATVAGDALTYEVQHPEYGEFTALFRK